MKSQNAGTESRGRGMTSEEFWYFFLGMGIILIVAKHILKEDK